MGFSKMNPWPDLWGFARQTTNGYPSGVHRPVEFWRGDTWQIPGKLFNGSMSPQDISQNGTAIAWTLQDINSNIIESLSLGSGITIVGDPTEGQILVAVTDLMTVGPSGHTTTQPIPHGNYWDRLVVTISGIKTTFWVGTIRVHDKFLLIDDLGLAGLGRGP